MPHNTQCTHWAPPCRPDQECAATLPRSCRGHPAMLAGPPRLVKVSLHCNRDHYHRQITESLGNTPAARLNPHKGYMPRVQPSSYKCAVLQTICWAAVIHIITQVYCCAVQSYCQGTAVLLMTSAGSQSYLPCHKAYLHPCRYHLPKCTALAVCNTGNWQCWGSACINISQYLLDEPGIIPSDHRPHSMSQWRAVCETVGLLGTYIA